MSTLKVNTLIPVSGDTINVDGNLTVGGESISGFPYTGSAVITGSLIVTGSGDLAVRVSGSTALTGSLFVSGTISGSFIGDGSGLTGIVTASHTAGTASFADYATSASYAISASHEITYETSSSLAETASFARTGDGIFSGSFSGSFEGDGTNLTGVASPTGSYTGSFTGSMLVDDGSGSFSGSFEGDGSNLTGVGGFPHTGSADITGSLIVTGSAFVTTLTETSALRYKKYVKGLSSQTDTVYQLRPVHFRWKNNNKKDYGLIAEEVQKIYPELVTSGENGDALGISYTKLTALLVKTIQELTDRVSDLENKLN